MSWLKTGAAAAAMYDKAEAEQKERDSRMKQMWRFALDKGEEARITFIDGNLGEDGLLVAPTFREHNMKINGRWGNHFVCTSEQEGQCPICEMTFFDQKAKKERNYWPSLVSALTIIDHRKIPSKKEPGKVYVDQKRLFVFNREVFKILQSAATKRGGLAGATFDVVRPDKPNSLRTGSSFDFVEKNPIAVLRSQFTIKGEDGKLRTYFTPAKYEEEIPYLSAKDLRARGFGQGGTVIGGEAPVGDTDDAPFDPDDDTIVEVAGSSDEIDSHL